ncbi:16698_t:CDS:2 [Acaulospora morrowiae]|uniref:16698_t:CDS:1 n=1 Tax=Acaulospora morrowiae TaxID=94023 RepID=A0A9N9H478_9GLOM|nr:16698_t:CDS:2 [Acaulospora morrowiae]
MTKWNRDIQKYDRNPNVRVSLKQLKDSQNISKDFFQELIAHLHCEKNNFVLRCYGITQDPESNEYIMVTDYAKKGDLRTYIRKQFHKIKWNEKLALLQNVACGLKEIHKEGWVHRDLHTGNLLLDPASINETIVIGDLGMCRPACQSSSSVYGVIPYMAPELFKGQPYSKESDIFSFGTILWEVSSGRLPFSDRPHDRDLIKEIANGLRPDVVDNTPNQYAELMWRCWDPNPSERPSASEIESILMDLRRDTGADLYLDKSYISQDHLSMSVTSVFQNGSTLSQFTSDLEDRVKEESQLIRSLPVNTQAIYSSRIFPN